MMLVDTNVISELIRQRPDENVLSWLADQQTRATLSGNAMPQWNVSVITVGEIQYGLACVSERWPTRELLDWFERFLAVHKVLPVTALIARRAGQLRGRLQAKGLTRMQPDILLAATAIEFGLTLVTRNIRDFEDCGVGLLDPFRA
jgi:toxin FitB